MHLPPSFGSPGWATVMYSRAVPEAREVPMDSMFLQVYRFTVWGAIRYYFTKVIFGLL